MKTKENKVCPRCLRELPRTQEFFDMKIRKNGSANPWLCHACKRKYNRSRYYKNHEKEKAYKRAYYNTDYWRAKRLVYQQKKIARHREYVQSVREGATCACCGDSRPYVLDFHHVDDDKVDTVSRLICDGNLESIKEEIQKCVLLCANCHRELHFSNADG